MHEKRIRKGIRLSVLAGLLALIMVMTAFADPLDLERTGSITVNMRTGDDSDAQAIPGGEMGIYKVADVNAVGGTQNNAEGGYFFEVIAPFTGTEYDFEGRLNGKTGDELNGVWSDLAEDMAAYAYSQAIVPDETKTIGDDDISAHDLRI